MSEPVLSDVPDTRTDGPMLGSEREVLDHWLDLYRQTALLKIEGLDAEQLSRRAIPPSALSLLGIMRHLTEVEAYWVKEVALGRDDLPDYYCTREQPDGDIELAGAPGAGQDVARYRAEVAECRELLSGVEDLDAPLAGRRRGREVNLRWVLTHLVEEYARHLGHMDLLREVVDGRTGY